MNNECWTEIDLYWFQGGEDKVGQLFDRLSSIWNRKKASRKGIAICIGWLYDSVLYFNGDMKAQIPCCQAPKYEAWTYERLGNLVSDIRNEAERRGIEDFHVAQILMGIQSNAFDEENTCEGWGGRTDTVEDKHYYNIYGKWLVEHTEVQDSRFVPYFFGSKMNVPSDEKVCTIKNPTFGEYFACKLCAFAKATGMDAVVLRDHIFAPAYIRGHKERYMDPLSAEIWTQSFIDLFSEIKRGIHDFIIIGYSTGTSSMEEWRSHGFDLEKVAKTGLLDMWITQTWASAWQDYWPAHSMGYSFQAQNALVNLAMLAETPCKHLFLIETFDAWEPWDSIHQFPKKVMWEIWTYSHMAAYYSGGIKRSEGCYISWMNHGADLLSEQTVALLCNTLNAVSDSLEENPLPGGPCLIYDRIGLEKSIKEPALYSKGEEMDDWAAMLMKFGVPIMGAVRSDVLSNVNCDGYIFPAPMWTSEILTEAVKEKISSGKMFMFMGQLSGIPEDIKQMLGIEIQETITSNTPSCAFVSAKVTEKYGVNGLMMNQRRRSLGDLSDFENIISCLGGSVFAKCNKYPNCFIWETPEWGTPYQLHLTTKSVGSPETYNIIASELSENEWGGFRWVNKDSQRPVCFTLWYYENGKTGLLFGNLETGFTGNSQFGVKGDLFFNTDSDDRLEIEMVDHFAPGKVVRTGTGLEIALAYHKCGMIKVSINE